MYVAIAMHQLFAPELSEDELKAILLEQSQTVPDTIDGEVIIDDEDAVDATQDTMMAGDDDQMGNWLKIVCN